MATRKIEVNEDDLKKVILILKLSKPHLRIPRDDLGLMNLWRVSGKLTDKLMRKAELIMVTNRGRTMLKPIEGVNSDVTDEEVSTERNLVEVKSEETSEAPVEKPMGKVPRCCKRKK